MDDITGQKFRLIRTGGLFMLGGIIKITKTFAPGKNDLYPAWQGMQYMRNMMDKRSTIDSTDNYRYNDIKWTTVKDLFLKNKGL